MSTKYVIDKTTLDGIGDAIREKKGTTDLIPVPNIASEIASISGGGSQSHIIKTETWTCQTGATLTHDNTTAHVLDLNAADETFPLAPDGAHVLVMVRNNLVSTVLNVNALKAVDKTILDKFSLLNNAQRCFTSAQMCGYLVTRNTNYTSLYWRMFDPHNNAYMAYNAIKDAIWSSDLDTLNASTNANLHGCFIADNKHTLVFVGRAAASTDTILVAGETYTLYWLDNDNVPMFGNFELSME